MSSKNISLKSSVYDRLQAYKRSDESFSDAIDRILDDTQPDWRSFVGTLSDEDAEQAYKLIEQRRERSIRESEEQYRELFGQ